MSKPTMTLASTTVTRTYTVTGAPLVKLQYRSTSIVPTRVTATFTDGKWTRMTIAGARAKKDGTPSDSGTSENVYYPGGLDEVPEWARALTVLDGGED